MGNFFSVRPARNFQTTNEESWIERVRQNARAFFELRSARVLAPGGAGAFDLLEGRPEPSRLVRQAGSLVLHAVAIGIILWMGGRVARNPQRIAEILKDPGGRIFGPPKSPADRPNLGKGSGGDKNLVPASAGELARRSPIVLLHPRIPDQQEHVLPMEPNILGDEELRRAQALGLPTMKDKSNSNGRNGKDGIGNGPGHTIGDGDEGGAGISNQIGGYVPGAYPVKCLYCPDPEYTDEARHTKTQGSVTLLVLVTADGRASQIKIVKGLGLGLDERAIEKVKTWRFEPGRDASKKAIIQWATVEVTYRLF